MHINNIINPRFVETATVHMPLRTISLRLSRFSLIYRGEYIGWLPCILNDLLYCSKILLYCSRILFFCEITTDINLLNHKPSRLVTSTSVTKLHGYSPRGLRPLHMINMINIREPSSFHIINIRGPCTL